MLRLSNASNCTAVMQGNICKKAKLCHAAFRKRRYEIATFAAKEWDHVTEMSKTKTRI